MTVRLNNESLGMEGTSLAAQLTIGVLKKTQEHHFRMTWKGDKTPRGATIGGKKIGWAQHGIMAAEGTGETLGYYTREAVFSGQDKRDHTIAISTKHADVFDPAGVACARVKAP